MKVGIDIGATNTHIIVATHQVELLNHVYPTSAWWTGNGLKELDDTRRLIDLFISYIENPSMTPIGIGAHGCDSKLQQQAYERSLAKIYPGPTIVVNDATLISHAASDLSHISLVVGTGSIATGRLQTGEVIRSGGYGWLIDDPGSAPTLVRHTVRALLISQDWGSPPDQPLQQTLFEYYGASTLRDLASAFSSNADIMFWAGACPSVFAAANDGSKIAQQQISSAATGLTTMIRQLVTRGAVGTTVIAAGGVITRQASLIQKVRDRLEEHVPGVSLDLLPTHPVYGALNLHESTTSGK